MKPLVRSCMRVALAGWLVIATAPRGSPQCLDWRVGFVGPGTSDPVRALAVFDDGGGPRLYAGGVRTHPSGNLAQWNGSAWSSVGGLSNDLEIHCLTVIDDGSGPALFAGGDFSLGSQPRNIARFDGASWTELGTGTDAPVSAIVQFDDGTGPAVFAGGRFRSAGGVLSYRIAKWNGTSWSELGTAINGGDVLALAVFDDGSGPALYAGGDFTEAGGVLAYSIARWNGTDWSAVGLGIQGERTITFVNALAVFDDGSGPALFAGGLFDTAGGTSVASIAKWNGSSWSGVSTGVDDQVRALAVFDDGSGPALFAGGSFTTAGGVSASRIAKWNGSSWSALGSGIDGGADASVFALCQFDDGSGGGADLFAGGRFTSAGGSASDDVAQWLGCGPGLPYCFGDGVDPIVTAVCPCANFGGVGHGCANSIFESGALLSASGTTTPNTVLFTASSIPNNNLTVGLRTTDNASPGGAVFGDGVRCQSGVLLRFGAHKSGTSGDAPNTWSSTTATVSPGATRYYQVQYRNPSSGFCPPETFNVSHGYRISW